MHVSLVPQPSCTGEHKTKPTQAGVRELRALGLSPDFIVCRSEKPINEAVKQKISNFCHVEPEQVIFFINLTASMQDNFQLVEVFFLNMVFC